MTGTLSDWLYLKKSDLTSTQLNNLRVLNTFSPKTYGNEEPEPIEAFVESDSKIGLPIAWATGRFDYIDERSLGVDVEFELCPDPSHPKAAEGQQWFVDTIVSSLKEFQVVTALASTGTGKTVSSMYVANKLGVTTLVIVPKVKLAHQWIDEAKLHLGLKDDEVAIIRGDKCKFQGKKLCVAVVNSIAMRDYGNAFRDYFGFVIWDEVHKVGARMFSQTLGRLNPTYRLGLTATPKRTDGMHEMIFHHLGDPLVVLETQPLQAKVYVHKSTAFSMMRKDATGRVIDGTKTTPRSILLNILAKNFRRNTEIVDIVKRAYDGGRNILVIGDRIDHLHALMTMCGERGIPTKDMGFYAGQRVVEETVRRVTTKKRVNVTVAELEEIEKNCRLIFSTYGVMKEGVDIPRMDCGIDVTPRSEAIQVIGRIRRKHKGKPTPIWITIDDTLAGGLQYSLKKRISDYRETGCTISELPYEKMKG